MKHLKNSLQIFHHRRMTSLLLNGFIDILNKKRYYKRVSKNTFNFTLIINYHMNFVLGIFLLFIGLIISPGVESYFSLILFLKSNSGFHSFPTCLVI